MLQPREPGYIQRIMISACRRFGYSTLCALLAVSWSDAAAAPLEPVLDQPSEGASVGVPLILRAQVEDDQGAALDATFHLRPAAPPVEPFSLVVLPDTQFYVYDSTWEQYGEAFPAQTAWIAQQREALGLAFVSHVGDIVQTWDVELEWERAAEAMSLLDGVIPYGIAAGNHDCDFLQAEDTGTWPCLFDSWFPVSRYEDQPWWGGSYGDDGVYSSYQLITAGGLKLLMLHLRFAPTPEDVAWAAEVIRAHPGRMVIVSTHMFLDEDGERLITRDQDSDELWEALVAPFPNVWFVLAGHVSGESRRRDEVAGHPVHQLMACYQTIDDTVGGDGFLRLMHFEPDAEIVQVETYSPWLDTWRDADSSSFELDWPPFPFATHEADEPTASGDHTELIWDDPLTDGRYEWFVSVRDAEGREAQSAEGTFTLDATPPAVTVSAEPQAGRSWVELAWSSSEPTTASVEILAASGQVKDASLDVLEVKASVRLEGLEPGQSHQATITVWDAVGNPASTSVDFDTLAEPEPQPAPEGCEGCSGRPTSRPFSTLGTLLLTALAALGRRRRRD